MVGTETWTINTTQAEDFLILIGLAQPVVFIIQLACASVRFYDENEPVVIKIRVKLYWLFLCVYVLVFCVGFFGLFYSNISDDSLAVTYFSYWFIWFYYILFIKYKFNTSRILQFFRSFLYKQTYIDFFTFKLKDHENQ